MRPMISDSLNFFKMEYTMEMTMMAGAVKDRVV